MSRHVLFYAISDADLYEQLESLLQEYFPERIFAFLGHTFADADAHPWRPGQKSNLLPTSRLLWRWVFMNEFTSNLVIPALEGGAYRAVFVREFGREAYHYAIRHQFCKETFPFHEGLVRSRLVAQGGRPPDAYLSRHPTEPLLIQADQEYFASPGQTMQYLEGNTPEERFDEAVRFLAGKLGVPTPIMPRPARQAVA